MSSKEDDMTYDKDENAEEVKAFKRRDPRPILGALGWAQKPGKAKARFVNARGDELDLWGGETPGAFFAFSVPGVAGRPKSVLDLALDKVGGPKKYKEACELLRSLFGTSDPLPNWAEGTEVPEVGHEYGGITITERNAPRLRVSPDGYLRVPMQAVMDGGLKVVGFFDYGSGSGTEGRTGAWATPSDGATEIYVYPEMQDALRGDLGGMSIWAPRGADRSASLLAKLAAEKLGLDHVIVAAPDTADGDLRRGEIRKMLADAGVETRGRIL